MTKHPGADGGTGGQAPGVHRTAADAPAGPPRGARPGVAGPQTDRLRHLDAATRQIAHGMNLDETLHELCRAAVPAFADVALVHLYAPLPVGDETSDSAPTCALSRPVA